MHTSLSFLFHLPLACLGEILEMRRKLALISSSLEHSYDTKAAYLQAFLASITELACGRLIAYWAMASLKIAQSKSLFWQQLLLTSGLPCDRTVFFDYFWCILPKERVLVGFHSYISFSLRWQELATGSRSQLPRILLWNSQHLTLNRHMAHRETYNCQRLILLVNLEAKSPHSFISAWERVILCPDMLLADVQTNFGFHFEKSVLKYDAYHLFRSLLHCLSHDDWAVEKAFPGYCHSPLCGISARNSLSSASWRAWLSIWLHSISKHYTLPFTSFASACEPCLGGKASQALRCRGLALSAYPYYASPFLVWALILEMEGGRGQKRKL